MKTTDGGANWDIEKTLTVPTGATSFGVGHFDSAASSEYEPRRGLDVVIGGEDEIFVHYAPDFPVVAGGATPALADWGTVSSTNTNTVLTGAHAIEKLIVYDANSDGYHDILFYAIDTAGGTKREILYSTTTSAIQRDISTLTPESVELSDEAGEEIVAMLPVDANQDGA